MQALCGSVCIFPLIRSDSKPDTNLYRNFLFTLNFRKILNRNQDHCVTTKPNPPELILMMDEVSNSALAEMMHEYCCSDSCTIC